MNRTDFHNLEEKINIARKHIKLAENILNHKPMQIEGESSHVLAWRNLNKSTNFIRIAENILKRYKTKLFPNSRKRKKLRKD